jgi:hypothetical protein
MNIPMSGDVAHKMLPTKNQRREITRLVLLPKISEKVPQRG